MKKLLLLSVLLALSLLLCTSISAQAATSATSVIVPFNSEEYVACVGETVAFSGDMHIVSHSFTSGGGIYHFSGEINFQGVSGIGLSTGDKYQYTHAGPSKFNGMTGGGRYEFTYITNFMLIGQGQQNNLIIHQTEHYTVTPNGTLTAEVVSYHIDCQS